MPSIDFTDLMAIYEVGALLEGQAGRPAAIRVHGTTREASRELGGAIKLAQAPTRTGGALLKLEKDVPRFVDAASRSLMLHQALDHYLDLSLRVIYVLLPSRPRLNDALSELLIRHRLLLAAIADGDFERAADAIRSGLRDLQQAPSGAVDSVA